MNTGFNLTQLSQQYHINTFYGTFTSVCAKLENWFLALLFALFCWLYCVIWLYRVWY